MGLAEMITLTRKEFLKSLVAIGAFLPFIDPAKAYDFLEAESIDIVSFDPDGFTVSHHNWGEMVHYYATDGRYINEGIFTIPNYTGLMCITGLGFQPHTVLFLNER